MATDVAPIGRITLQQADPAAEAMASKPDPGGASPTVPSDSPYTPLNLPQQDVKRPIPQLQPQQDPQNLGAVTHAGAVAYLADKVLRGAMQGMQQKQQHQIDQQNKKLTAQQQVYNDQAAQLYKMAQAGVDPNSQEFKDARNRVLTSWQATMQTIGASVAPQGKGKKKQDDSPLAAVYQGAVSTGPPVFHQIQPYLDPAYRAKQQQSAQTAATQAGAAQSTAEFGAKKAQLENTLLDAESKGDKDGAEKAKQALSDLQEATSPYHRPTVEENRRADYQVLLTSGQVPKDAQNNPLSYEAWTASQGAAGRVAGTPKPLQYDPKTDQVVDAKTGKRWSVGEKGMPVEVASVFKGANSATFEKQQRALQLLGAHTNAALSSHAVQVPDPNNPGNTIWMPVGQAIKTGASGTGSADHKGAVQERAGLVKQELDAKKDFNNASTNLSMMLKTADAARKGDGSAQVGILANYLKTVVGGQGTGLRITKAEWDAAAKTRPWMTGIQATFSPAGIMTGAAIAPSQVDQMIQEVHQKTKALHETYQSAQQAALAPKAAAPVITPQTHVFDSKAWAAANPKGDVEAAKAQAKAKGYEVQ